MKPLASTFLQLTFVDGNLTSTHDIYAQIGFDITMDRILQPFLLQFYVPAIIIVMVSQSSFMVTLSAIPGRITLVVTQFLVLTNVFIHQQVRIKSCYSYTYDII